MDLLTMPAQGGFIPRFLEDSQEGVQHSTKVEEAAKLYPGWAMVRSLSTHPKVSMVFPLRPALGNLTSYTCETVEIAKDGDHFTTLACLALRDPRQPSVSGGSNREDEAAKSGEACEEHGR